MENLQRLTRLSTKGDIVRLANILVVVLISISLLLLYISLDGTYVPATGIIISALCLANTLFIERTDNTHAGGWILIGILIYGQVSVGYISGGFAGPIIYATPVIPVLAVVLVDTRAGWVAYILTTTVLVILYLLQINELLPAYPLTESGTLMGRLIALVFTGLIATWVTWEFAGSAIRLTRKSEDKANTDHLTQLANRRSVDEALNREIARAQRLNGWFSLIMTDVDFFKKYNDVNGHQAGDRCLTEVARLIKITARRATDLAGRYGGEEFIVLLPDTDDTGGVHVAEKIREALQQNQAAVCTPHTDKVSLTLGVVSARGKSIDSGAQLIKLADEALYEGKHKGRDCVVSKLLGSAEG